MGAGRIEAEEVHCTLEDFEQCLVEVKEVEEADAESCHGVYTHD